MGAQCYIPPSAGSKDYEAWTDCWELAALIGPTTGVSVQHLPEPLRLRLQPRGKAQKKKPTRASKPCNGVKVPQEEILAPEWSALQDKVVRIIKIRNASCRGGYPFACQSAASFKITRKEHRSEDIAMHSYVFMLLATRMDMGKHRSAKFHGSLWTIMSKPEGETNPAEWLDGAELFEQLCCAAITGYLGPRCQTHHFGAGPGQSKMKLIEKVAEALRHLKDGALPKASDKVMQVHGDGGLDLIAWLQFTENAHDHVEPRPGKLLVFGQCKTGTSYEIEDASKLNPTLIVEQYLEEAFGILSTNIVRVFMVANRPDKDSARKFNRAGGLLFDRCRITDCIGDAMFSSESPFADLPQKIQNWVAAARECSWFHPVRSHW